MKALKYKVIVGVDPVHSYMDHPIQEVWVPSCKVCFNEEGGIFESSEPRAHEEECEEIFIPPFWSDVLEKYIKKKCQIKSFIGEIFLTIPE